AGRPTVSPPRDPRASPPPTHRARNVARDPPPGPRRAEQAAPERIEQAALEMVRDLARHIVERKPRHPFSERVRNGYGSVGVHPACYCTTSLSSVRVRNALSSTVIPSPGPLGGRTWPSWTRKFVSGTSGSGPMTPHPNIT